MRYCSLVILPLGYSLELPAKNRSKRHRFSGVCNSLTAARSDVVDISESEYRPVPCCSTPETA